VNYEKKQKGVLFVKHCVHSIKFSRGIFGTVQRLNTEQKWRSEGWGTWGGGSDLSPQQVVGLLEFFLRWKSPLVRREYSALQLNSEVI